MDEAADNWRDVEPHIERHDCGCWTWDGTSVDGNIYRIIAEAYGAPIPVGRGKLYRMPNCTMGKPCVNPNHIGTNEDFVLALNGRRRKVSGRSDIVPMVRLTRFDRQFLKELNIRWE